MKRKTKMKCAAVVASVILASAIAGCGTEQSANVETASVDSEVDSMSGNTLSLNGGSVAEQQELSEQQTEDNGFEFCFSLEGIEPIYYNIPKEFNIWNFTTLNQKYDGTPTTVMRPARHYLENIGIFGVCYVGDPEQSSTIDFSKISDIDIGEFEALKENMKIETGNVVDSVETPYGKADIYYNFKAYGMRSNGVLGTCDQMAVLENGSKTIAIHLEGEDTDGEYGGEMRDLITTMFTPVDGINQIPKRMTFPDLTDMNVKIDETACDTLFGNSSNGALYGAKINRINGEIGGSIGDGGIGRTTDDTGREFFVDCAIFSEFGTVYVIAQNGRQWFEQQYLIENNRNGAYRIEEVREADEITLQAGQVKIYYAKARTAYMRYTDRKGNQLCEQEIGILHNNGQYVIFVTLGEYDGEYDGALKELLLAME